MTPALIAGFVWVLCAAAVATLPMRRQMAPGFALLLSAPVLILWIGVTVAWWAGALGFLAFLSMFRRPLGALLRWAFGREGRA